MRNFKDYTTVPHKLTAFDGPPIEMISKSDLETHKSLRGGAYHIANTSYGCGFRALCHSMNVSYEYGWNNLDMRDFDNNGSEFSFSRYLPYMDGRWQWSLEREEAGTYFSRIHSRVYNRSVNESLGVMIWFGDFPHVVAYFRGQFNEDWPEVYDDNEVAVLYWVHGSPSSKLR